LVGICKSFNWKYTQNSVTRFSVVTICVCLHQWSEAHSTCKWSGTACVVQTCKRTVSNYGGKFQHLNAYFYLFLELYNLYSSPNIWMITYRRISQERHKVLIKI